MRFQVCPPQNMPPNAQLDLQRIQSFHGDGGVVIAAAVGIVNPAGPFRARRLHADQDFLAGLLGISTEVLAAWLDANMPGSH
jgi:hypothetical protein